MSDTNDTNDRKLEEARRMFFVDEDLDADRIADLAVQVRRHCTVDKRGRVRVNAQVKGAKNQIQVALIARAIAARLGNEISEDLNVAELAEAATPRLANDVVSARCNELVKDKCVESPRRGCFRIRQDRIERFLDILGGPSLPA